MSRRVFTEPWKDARDGVVVGLEAEIRHRIYGERNVKAQLVRLPRRRLDTDAGRHTREHDLSDVQALQMRLFVTT